MLAFSVREALRQACAAFGPENTSVDLGCPSTPEAVYWSLDAARDGTSSGSAHGPDDTGTRADGDGQAAAECDPILVGD